MDNKIFRRISRARDKRADMQLQEAIKQAKAIESLAKEYAQEAADIAEENSKSYTDTHENKDNPHSGSASNSDISNLQQQIDDLEARVTALENA